MDQVSPGDYYVWTGYVKPGTHTAVVARDYTQSNHSDNSSQISGSSFDERSDKGDLNGGGIEMYRRSFIVTSRKEEVDVVSTMIEPLTSEETKESSKVFQTPG